MFQRRRRNFYGNHFQKNSAYYDNLEIIKANNQRNRKKADGGDGDGGGRGGAAAGAGAGAAAARAGDDGDDMDEDGTAAAAAAFVPQIKLVDGKMVVDEKSTVVMAPAPAAEEQAEFQEVVFENANQHVSASAYVVRNVVDKWTRRDTRLFFRALLVWGLDFGAIERLFPNRDRTQIRTKYNKEERKNPQLVQAALDRRRTIDADTLRRLIDADIRRMRLLTNRTMRLEKKPQDDDGSSSDGADDGLRPAKRLKMAAAEELNEKSNNNNSNDNDVENSAAAAAAAVDVNNNSNNNNNNRDDNPSKNLGNNAGKAGELKKGKKDDNDDDDDDDEDEEEDDDDNINQQDSYRDDDIRFEENDQILSHLYGRPVAEHLRR